MQKHVMAPASQKFYYHYFNNFNVFLIILKVFLKKTNIVNTVEPKWRTEFIMFPAFLTIFTNQSINGENDQQIDPEQSNRVFLHVVLVLHI